MRRRPRSTTAIPGEPQLESLAPQFSEEQHGPYLRMLERAINGQPDIKNIALAGTYGTGKSSVLLELAKRHRRRVVEVSLLTLGVDTDSPPAADSNPAAGTKTNRIQKEIVKQLLYQQRPSDAPESRFRRISKYRWNRELSAALIVGVTALIIAVASGLDSWVITRFGGEGAAPPAYVSNGAAYLAIVALPTLAVLLTRLLMQGRLGIEKVSAGPATINLPPRSSSYFDEYLDEIIYFFETNKTRDVVILEDLDRFDDPRIFESLRSLNGTLNAARQLNGRKVRFIYAVRDSVFEKLGRDAAPLVADEARAEVLRANRTKFFDLVVPVVPFITHRNARDLMNQVLTGRGHTIPRSLIDIAARHVADMRLIHNIINEYEVFKHRLLDVATPVPELDAERLFAMILFKNAHMGDFEAIRHGASSLDHLYETWRALVSANLVRLRHDDAAIHARLESEAAAHAYVQMLAERLRDRIRVLVDAPGSALSNSDLRRQGLLVTDDQLKTVTFWRQLIDDNDHLSLLWRDVYGRSQEMQFSPSALHTLLGAPIDPGPEIDTSLAVEQARLQENSRGATFLRHHTWRALVDEPNFVYASASDGTARSFRQWVEHLMPSRLATDLVLNGYITAYFSLHVSSFYGQLIRPDAMTYVMRNVDRGTADADFVLTGADVEAILADQPASVLTERSMHNVSIVDHLLRSHPDAAEVVVVRIAESGREEQPFIDHYLTAGSAVPLFVQLLAHHWPEVFVYLARDAPLPARARATLFDLAVIHQNAQLHYTAAAEVRAFVERTYAGMPSLTVSGSTHAAGIVSFIQRIEARLDALQTLSELACEWLAKTRAYLLTAENIARLTGSDNIALDRLRSVNESVYSYAMESISQYLDAQSGSASTPYTVASADAFEEVLVAANGWSANDFDRVIVGADPSCRVQNLKRVPTTAWPSLLASCRSPATFENVSTYLQERAGTDSSLAALLRTVRAIEEAADADPQARQALAITLINSGSFLPDARHRIALVESLAPEQLEASSITPESGELVGLLLGAGLLADDEEAFSSRLMTDYETLESAVRSSSRFREFAGPEVVPASLLPPLLRSRKVGREVKQALVSALDDYESLPRDVYAALGDLALKGEIILATEDLELIQRGGVGALRMVQLLAEAGDRVDVEDLRKFLRAMPPPYSVVADRGSSRPKFPDSPALRSVLNRLRIAGVVSSVSALGKSQLRVTLKQV